MMKALNHRTVIYMYSNAFTTCDCGNELVLAQTIVGDPVYRGNCECGKRFELFNNLLSLQQ